MTKNANQTPQPPWRDPGDLVHRPADGRRAIVLGEETGYFGTLYRVRMLDDGSELELPREELVYDGHAPNLLVVAEVRLT
jgi:hypothetical protein